MRVLLVEDDSATAQSIELMLKVDSFNVYQSCGHVRVLDHDALQLLGARVVSNSIQTSLARRAIVT